MNREQELRWTLPNSWVWTKLSALGHTVSGGTPSTREPTYWTDEINWITPADLRAHSAKTINRGSKGISRIGLANSSARVMPAGSVHFSTRAPIGYVVISSEPLATNQGFKSLVPAPGIFNEYVYYYLMASQEYARKRASGTTFLELSGSAFGDLPVPLAPTTAQHKIVAKIEELFSELDKGIENLNAARAKLDVYRQAVLKHAFEGKLTAQWRKENKDKLDTPEQLLARIRREQAERYEQQLKVWKAAIKAWMIKGKQGQKPRKPETLTSLCLPSEVEVANLPHLPFGWLWTTVNTFLLEPPRNGHSVKHSSSGFPVLRLNAIKKEKLDLSEQKNGAWEREDALSYLVREGDFLLARGNGSKQLVGRGGLVPALEHDIAYPDTMIRLRVNRSVIGRSFFSYVWNSHLLRRQIEGAARTTAGIYKINQGQILNFNLPLCSLIEQAVVVRQLSSILSVIDRIETEVNNQLGTANQLRQSILKKAFSGQLVAQDPNDEPASVLLERIRAERAKAAKSSHPRKAKKRKHSA